VSAPQEPSAAAGLPPLRELGPDLTKVSAVRRFASLAAPFVWSAAYFGCFAAGWHVPAVLPLVALSFVTYGSTSHDLVHGSLRLRRGLNDVLLSVIEFVAVRSGHAYRAAHLHHHARYPHPDDVEGAAAHMSLPRALAEGVVFPVRVWCWALRHAPRDRAWVVGEGAACVALVAAAIALAPVTPVLLVYVALMVAGGWIIPAATSYFPHTPQGKDALFQTRRFRGAVASAVALEHLYHLEHHLYPSVPHHNWPRLARRLDPFLDRAGVRVVKFWF
jgi:beta-carotene hydroxylase